MKTEVKERKVDSREEELGRVLDAVAGLKKSEDQIK